MTWLRGREAKTKIILACFDCASVLQRPWIVDTENYFLNYYLSRSILFLVNMKPRTVQLKLQSLKVQSHFVVVLRKVLVYNVMVRKNQNQ